MAAPQIAPLPPFFELSDGMQIRVTAVDPATNSTVSAVVISAVSIDVDPIETAAPIELPEDTPWLVPMAN